MAMALLDASSSSQDLPLPLLFALVGMKPHHILPPSSITYSFYQGDGEGFS
jgi:hypothetical protein